MHICSAALVSCALTFGGLGCGSGGNGTGDVADASRPDAVFADAGPLDPTTCPSTYGPSTVFSTLEVVDDSTVGFDLNGDAVVDNIMSTTAALLNQGFKDDIADGTLRSLIELRDLDSLAADDSSMTVVLFGGVDSDMPPVLADDLDGTEDYLFRTSWVDMLDCAPLSSAPGTYVGGSVTAAAETLVFFVPSLGGFLDFGKAQVAIDVEATGKGFGTPAAKPGLFGGAIKLCSLTNGTTIIGKNSLHALAQFLGIQPDIDLDGDGLETIQTDSSGILGCTDGDGTAIPGELCGCDPRMADGYSITLRFDTVGAGILGPAPAPAQ